MPVWVEDRKVYVNTQGTQTLKICTWRNNHGEYEKYYRVYPPLVLSQQNMEAEAARFKTLRELEAWLTADRKARRERDKEVAPPSRVSVVVAEPTLDPLAWQTAPRAALPAPDPVTAALDAEVPSVGEIGDTLSEILDLVSPSGYSPDEDPWLQQARKVVEDAIDKVVRDFVENPYLHRVEHSIHAELFRAIVSHPDMSRRYPLGDDLAVTQLVHKEWPETSARGGRRRGNFDIAVLSPQLLKTCQGVDMFLDGRLEAPIVIEVGLDYDADHLANDAKKLINSRPKFGYVVHLVRNAPEEPVAAKIILGLEARTGFRTAYARVTGGQKDYKFLNDTDISHG